MRRDRGGQQDWKERGEQDVKQKSQPSEVRYVKEVFLGTLLLYSILRRFDWNQRVEAIFWVEKKEENNRNGDLVHPLFPAGLSLNYASSNHSFFSLSLSHPKGVAMSPTHVLL